MEYNVHHVLNRWYLLVQRNRDWRLGQALFNALYDEYPNLANEVRGVMGLDPFHRDLSVPTLLIWLEQRLSGVDVPIIV